MRRGYFKTTVTPALITGALTVCIFPLPASAAFVKNIDWPEIALLVLFPILNCDQESVLHCSQSELSCGTLFEAPLNHFTLNFKTKILTINSNKSFPFSIGSSTVGENGYDGYVKLNTTIGGMSLHFDAPYAVKTVIDFSLTGLDFTLTKNDAGKGRSIALGVCSKGNER